MALNPTFWRARRVLLTGHTGFKGGWLALWLRQLGAEVYGLALPPSTVPSLWETARVAEAVDGCFADIREAGAVHKAVLDFQPEVVFHLAAQALVRESYRSPADTYAVNVMGTVNLLEAVRQCPSVKAVVVVTTDKCYENRDWQWPYRENDALGGADPYSNSKACVELVCSAYRDSFLRAGGAALATARAGNVVGGGDWSPERLVPDVLAAWQAGETVTLRYPHATRPWQHVFEPLMGYLLLAQALFEQGDAFAEAWNFGPDAGGVASVQDVVSALATAWGGSCHWVGSNAQHPHEAGLLALDSSNARVRLGWRPSWSLHHALEHTLAWHLAWQGGQDMQQFSREQIAVYLGDIA